MASADRPGPGAPGGAGKPPPPPGEKKIFVKSDESWKAEAQKEKDRLQKQAEESRAEPDLPPASFLSLVSDLGLQAMFALGLARVKGAGEPKIDLPGARYAIDLLGMLEEKTRGNLTGEEAQLLRNLLLDLRLRYVARSTGREE